MSEFKVFTIKDLSKIFHVNTNTIGRWIRTQDLPAPRKIGKQFFFDAYEIQQWFDRKGEEGRKIYQPY